MRIVIDIEGDEVKVHRVVGQALPPSDLRAQAASIAAESAGAALVPGAVAAYEVSRPATRDAGPAKSCGRSRSRADMKTSSLAYPRQRQSKGGTRVRKLLISASVEKPAALCGWISGIAITSTASPTCNGRSTTAGHGSHIPGI